MFLFFKNFEEVLWSMAWEVVYACECSRELEKNVYLLVRWSIL